MRQFARNETKLFLHKSTWLNPKINKQKKEPYLAVKSKTQGNVKNDVAPEIEQKIL